MASKAPDHKDCNGAAVAPKGQESPATKEGMRIMNEAVAKATASETQRQGKAGK